MVPKGAEVGLMDSKLSTPWQSRGVFLMHLDPPPPVKDAQRLTVVSAAIPQVSAIVKAFFSQPNSTRCWRAKPDVVMRLVGCVANDRCVQGFREIESEFPNCGWEGGKNQNCRSGP